MKKYYLIVVFVFTFTTAFAQKSDTLTLNTPHSKKILSTEIDENSGLIYLKKFLFTFNDSGGKPEIYILDPTNGNIKSTILITNAYNVDWEASTTDGEYIYIGDFGNNRGNRKNLTIYKIIINSIDFNKNYQEIESTKITFEMEGQETFEDRNRKNDYDIESMVYFNNKIHFFTKEWLSTNTTHHILDPNIPHQISKKLESFPIGYLVTDATLDNGHLLMVGYTKESLAFLSIFKTSNTDYFFKEPLQKIFIGLTPSIGQIEGITTSDKNIFISGEALRYNGFYHDQVFYTLKKMY